MRMTVHPELELKLDLVQPLLEGASSIDAPRLFLRTVEDAEAFLACYGFLWNRPGHRRQLEALRQEAWSFLEEELLADEPQLKPLPSVREETDVRRVLLAASAPADGHPERPQFWACTLLRVMHTFAHCGSTFKTWFGRQIEDQVLARFQPHLMGEGDTLQLGTGPHAIELERFEIKGSKSRRSLAMKLLHKSDNVAADVFDHMGVRFVTRERYDALLVAQYLRQQSVLMFAHVKPGRSRNTLIEMDRLQADLRKLQDGRMIEGLTGTSRDTLRAIVRRYPYPRPPEAGRNVFTSIAYHSIQFTCSQQIVIEEDDARTLRQRLEEVGLPVVEESALATLVERLSALEEVRFLFPFEVQITDERSYSLSKSGLASHEVYKRRQRHAVKRRLWGDLIPPEPRLSE